jgi:hypothetical protein
MDYADELLPRVIDANIRQGRLPSEWRGEREQGRGVQLSARDAAEADRRTRAGSGKAAGHPRDLHQAPGTLPPLVAHPSTRLAWRERPRGTDAYEVLKIAEEFRLPEIALASPPLPP